MLPQARKDDLVVQELNGEVLVYDTNTSKVVCLNSTSAIVWRYCDGASNTAEIARAMEKELGSPVKEEMVWFAINQLNKENLLKPSLNYSDKFQGLSRREVITKIGIGTMVALPVIASLVAPSSVMAQSCFSLPLSMGQMQIAGCPCLAPADCAGGNCSMTNNMC